MIKAVIGNLNDVVRIVKVSGYASGPSDLLVEPFRPERATPARATLNQDELTNRHVDRDRDASG